MYSRLRLIGSRLDQAILTRLSELKVLARLTGVNIHLLYGSVSGQLTRLTDARLSGVYCMTII